MTQFNIKQGTKCSEFIHPKRPKSESVVRENSGIIMKLIGICMITTMRDCNTRMWMNSIFLTSLDENSMFIAPKNELMKATMFPKIIF
jgi:hypothetical protein